MHREDGDGRSGHMHIAIMNWDWDIGMKYCTEYGVRTVHLFVTVDNSGLVERHFVYSVQREY